MWRLWCKALGEKASEDDREADKIALIRSIFIIQAMVANLIIILGVIRHW